MAEVIIILDKSGGDLSTALPLDPQRAIEDLDWIEITDGPVVKRKQYHEPVVVVPLDESRRRGFIGLKKYIEFATRVKKMPSSFNNVLVVNADDFMKIISANNR